MKRERRNEGKIKNEEKKEKERKKKERKKERKKKRRRNRYIQTAQKRRVENDRSMKNIYTTLSIRHQHGPSTTSKYFIRFRVNDLHNFLPTNKVSYES